MSDLKLILLVDKLRDAINNEYIDNYYDIYEALEAVEDYIEE